MYWLQNWDKQWWFDKFSHFNHSPCSQLENHVQSLCHKEGSGTKIENTGTSLDFGQLDICRVMQWPCDTVILTFYRLVLYSPSIPSLSYPSKWSYCPKNENEASIPCIPIFSIWFLKVLYWYRGISWYWCNSKKTNK